MRICLIGIVFAMLISYASAIKPSPAGGRALDLRAKRGYYYAEDVNDCFDNDLLKNGFTIEFWFCPARPVKRAEAWNLISKPPIFVIEVVYSGMPANEWMCMRYAMAGGLIAKGFFDLSKAKDYDPEWHHFIFQGQVSGNWFSGITFFDGISGGSFSSSSFPTLEIDSDEPLYIGGIGSGFTTFVRVDEKDMMTVLTTFDGLIDEIRISSIQRYDQKPFGDKIRVPGRFEADKHTVALWHFDEDSSLEYADASGNGHTLLASKELSVMKRAKVATVWGRIKK